MPEYVSKAGGVGLALVLTVEDIPSLTGSMSGSVDTGSFLITASFANPFLSFSKGDGTQFYLNLETLVPINAQTASFVTGSSVYGPYGSNSVISSSWSATAATASYVPPYGAAASPPETSVQFNSGGFFEGRAFFTYEYGTESLQQGLKNEALGYYSHAEGAGTWTGQYGYSANRVGYHMVLDAGYGDVTGVFSGVDVVVIDDLFFFSFPTTVGIQITSTSFDGTNTLIYSDQFDPNWSYLIIGVPFETNPPSADQLIRGWIGYGDAIDGNAAHSEGDYTIAAGHRSHAEGSGSHAIGGWSHAEGKKTIAAGLNSHAEGEDTLALRAAAHAEGSGSKALGLGSHAEGYNTIATGAYSHAEGYATFAASLGPYPGHAEGSDTVAVLGSSRGIGTVAAGSGAHAEGAETVAGFLGFSALQQAAFNETGSWLVPIPGDPIVDVSSFFTPGNKLFGYFYDFGGNPVGLREYTISSSIYTPGVGTLVGVYELIHSIYVSYILDLDSWTQNPRAYATASGISYYIPNINNNAQSWSFHSEGISTAALGQGSHAEGGYTSTRGLYSHTEGYFTLALNTASHAEGYYATSSGVYAHAEGYYTRAQGLASHAEGNFAATLGSASHAEGTYTSASGNYSHAEGSSSFAAGEASHAEGIGTRAEGVGAHAEGLRTRVPGDFAHAQGELTVAFGAGSHAEGHFTTASGDYSHAEGYLTIVDGGYGHAEGSQTLVGVDFAHAEGSASVAAGVASHAEGFYTTASGEFAHAEGYESQAVGSYSHAEGINTISIGHASHAEGENTQALGEHSHAEGIQTVATGISAHAEGFNTNAVGTYSHAEGNGTIAYRVGQHASGQYNIDLNNRDLFVIGDGTNSSNRHDLVNASIGWFRISGSAVVSSSLIVVGSSTVSGSNTITGSWQLTGGGQVTGSLIVSGSLIVQGATSLTGSVLITGSVVHLGSHTLTGSLTVSGSLIANRVYLTGSLTGSFFGSGSGHFNGIFSGSLFGTSSWAINAITASYITSSGVNGPYGPNSILSASYSVTSSHSVTTRPAGGLNEIQFNGGSGSLAASSNLSFTELNELNIRSITDNGSGKLPTNAGVRLCDLNETSNVQRISVQQVSINRSVGATTRTSVITIPVEAPERVGFLCNYVIVSVSGDTRCGQLICSWKHIATGPTTADYSLVDTNNVASTPGSEVGLVRFDLDYDVVNKQVSLYADCTMLVDNVNIGGMYTIFTYPY